MNISVLLRNTKPVTCSLYVYFYHPGLQSKGPVSKIHQACLDIHSQTSQAGLWDEHKKGFPGMTLPGRFVHVCGCGRAVTKL